MVGSISLTAKYLVEERLQNILYNVCHEQFMWHVCCNSKSYVTDRVQTNRDFTEPNPEFKKKDSVWVAEHQNPKINIPVWLTEHRTFQIKISFRLTERRIFSKTIQVLFTVSWTLFVDSVSTMYILFVEAV